jgi:hypothetical protein
MLSLMLPQLRLDAQAIKLQYNAGALNIPQSLPFRFVFHCVSLTAEQEHWTVKLR